MNPVDRTSLRLPSRRPTRRQRAHWPALALALMAPLAAPATAQSITTQFTGAAVGGGGPNQVFLDITVTAVPGITIQSLDVHLTDLPGTSGFITLRNALGSYLAPGQTVLPLLWASTLPQPVVAEGPGKPSHVCFPGGVFLPTGANTLAVHYAGVFANALVMPPLPLPPVAAPFDANVALFYGDAQNTAWGLLNPGHALFDGTIYYQVGFGTACGNCASKVSVGAACASTCPPFPVLNVDADFPVLGEQLDIVTTGASPCAGLGIDVIGFTPIVNTPLLLPPFTCFVHQTIDMNAVFIPSGGGWTWTLQLPANPALCGMTFYVQSATMETPLNFPTSNGLAMTIGN